MTLELVANTQKGARALIRVSEQSNREGQWPKLAPRRNYAGTKYSNDLSVGRQKITPKPVLPKKHFLTPKFAKKKTIICLVRLCQSCTTKTLVDECLVLSGKP